MKIIMIFHVYTTYNYRLLMFFYLNINNVYQFIPNKDVKFSS